MEFGLLEIEGRATQVSNPTLKIAEPFFFHTRVTFGGSSVLCCTKQGGGHLGVNWVAICLPARRVSEYAFLHALEALSKVFKSLPQPKFNFAKTGAIICRSCIDHARIYLRCTTDLFLWTQGLLSGQIQIHYWAWMSSCLPYDWRQKVVIMCREQELFRRWPSSGIVLASLKCMLQDSNRCICSWRS